MNNTYNSANKIIGTTDVTPEKIIINTRGKPLLIIEDKEIIEGILAKNRTNEFVRRLFDEQNLLIGEIASLFNVVYSNINSQLKSIAGWKADKKGRRNSSYNTTFSEERRKKISKSHLGKKATCPPYRRTPEIRARISASVRKYQQEHPEDPTPHINNWKNGKYDYVDFTRGIGGFIWSEKMNMDIFFRSLLELKFAISLEENNTVLTYKHEPFKIIMDNGRNYTPDFLVNSIDVIELKARKFVETVSKDEVEYKKEQAEKYCKNHNLNYKIVYDDEIDFKSDVMIQFIKNHPEVVEKYNIRFQQPERVYGRKK